MLSTGRWTRRKKQQQTRTHGRPTYPPNNKTAGLGAPVGSAVVGSADFISRAHRVRKALGGGMRQSGVVAAAAMEGLRKQLPRLSDDHANARRLAQVRIPRRASFLPPTFVSFLVRGEDGGAEGVLKCCLSSSFDYWPHIPFETAQREGREGGRGVKEDLCFLLNKLSIFGIFYFDFSSVVCVCAWHLECVFRR